jgi:hypothetical protein
MSCLITELAAGTITFSLKTLFQMGHLSKLESYELDVLKKQTI